MLGPSVRMRKKLEYPPGAKTKRTFSQRHSLLAPVLLAVLFLLQEIKKYHYYYYSVVISQFS